jgi:hypothetical protein
VIFRSPRAGAQATAFDQRWASFGSAFLLIGAVALVGEAAIQSVYTADVLARLVLLAGVMLVGIVFGGAHCPPPMWSVLVSALLTVRAMAVAPPLANVVSNGRLLIGVLVVAAVPAVVPLLPLVRKAHALRVAAVGLGVAAAGYALVVLGGVPVIDVWTLLQGAGNGLAAGLNPYELTFPGSPPGQTTDCFTYLPAATLLTAPAVWLGDARWAELAALTVAGALLVRSAPRRGGTQLGLAVLVVVLPATARLVQQAWTETLLLPSLVATAVLAERGRTGWAAVAAGIALATKQHVLLLAPLLLLCRFRLRDLAGAAATAAVLTVPWLLVDPGRFYTCTVDFFLSAAAPSTSLSLWSHLPEPLRLPLLGAALLAGYLLAWRYCPRSGGGFLIAAAVVLTTFGLVNKQTFLNQWWLVAALVTAGLAMTPLLRDSGSGIAAAAGPPTGVQKVHHLS